MEGLTVAIEELKGDPSLKQVYEEFVQCREFMIKKLKEGTNNSIVSD